MRTLRTLIGPAIIATGLSFISGQASADTNSDSVLPQKIYFDNGSAKMNFLEGSLSWQISILHADAGVVTNNIEIDLIDKGGFVIETLYSFCIESKPFSLTLFRGISTLHSDIREIKTLLVRIKSMGEDFCHGYGVNKGELQIAGEDLIEWVKTATLSEYLRLPTSN